MPTQPDEPNHLVTPDQWARLHALVRHLKKVEKCAACSIEAQPCTACRDARWAGRELARILANEPKAAPTPPPTGNELQWANCYAAGSPNDQRTRCTMQFPNQAAVEYWQQRRVGEWIDTPYFGRQQILFVTFNARHYADHTDYLDVYVEMLGK